MFAYKNPLHKNFVMVIYIMMKTLQNLANNMQQL